MTRQTWRLTPHDPLVLGTGRRPPALFPRMVHRVPLPATLAGAVRARFAEGATDLSIEAAQKLLDQIEVRGPWLQRGDRVLVPAPRHVLAYRVNDEINLVPPERVTLNDGEGALVPRETPGLLRWEKPSNAHKLRPLDGFVSLDLAVDLLLGRRESLCPHELEVPAVFEGRVHVSIDVESQTAAHAMLYSSSGVRYADDVTLCAEVTASGDHAAPGERLIVLGGESRVVALTRTEGDGFPRFDTVRERYERALGENRGTPSLLLMAVTPASFSTGERDVGPGWLPSWLRSGGGEVPGLAGVRLKLHAVAFERYLAMSGWSMAFREGGHSQGRQRAVRRLMPSGSVYVLDFEAGAERSLEACERFWWSAIDEGTPKDDDALLAAPHRDGYGMVIPGLWWPKGEGR